MQYSNTEKPLSLRSTD